MISLLVINYRSAQLAIEAIRSAREATTAPLQIVVVDNSLDPGEADLVRSHADTILTPDKNLGYAGGVNAGRAECSGEIIIVSNPDVVFGPRSIDELVHVLDDEKGAAVAGPALFWDDAFMWMLPPSELHSASDKLDEAFASRSRLWARHRDRRRIRERTHFWSLPWPTRVDSISGAVMAIRAADFDAVKGFDERFPLYFEENDFLRRIAKAGKRIMYVPYARCRHLYNQSAGSDSSAAARAYAESEMLYLSKWYGGAVARTLKRIERPRQLPEPPAMDAAIFVPSRDVVIEASPLRSFDTAAGHFPRSAEVILPDEVWQSYRSPVLYFRVIDRPTTKVIATYARYRS
jgi:N-acetylglucosaminyl-diphospho-decaprenol L-rhamnosyltransferase